VYRLSLESSVFFESAPVSLNQNLFSFVTVDILAVLLNDVLLLLQEKDQKYVFASVVGIGHLI